MLYDNVCCPRPNRLCSSLFDMAAHQQGHVWEETSAHTVLWAFVDKWRFGFQCGKYDDESGVVADDAGDPKSWAALSAWKKKSCGSSIVGFIFISFAIHIKDPYPSR